MKYELEQLETSTILPSPETLEYFRKMDAINKQCDSITDPSYHSSVAGFNDLLTHSPFY